jgi:hypothetical protein
MSEQFVAISFYTVLILGIVAYTLLICAVIAAIVFSAVWLVKQIGGGAN